MASLKNTEISTTGFIQLPVGTDAQRPTSAVPGYLRFNTTSGLVEVYTGVEWKFVGS